MAEKKLSDVRALEASLEEKSLEIEAKLHSADARLAEASRKNSQADHKLEEIQERERKFDKDKLSHDTEYASLFFTFLDLFTLINTLLDAVAVFLHRHSCCGLQSSSSIWSKKKSLGEKEIYYKLFVELKTFF